MNDVREKTRPLDDLRERITDPNVQILQVFKDVPDHLKSATVVVNGT